MSESGDLRVKNSSSVNELAQRIHKLSESGVKVTLHVLGVAPTSQSVKAVARANSLAASGGKYYYIIPAFQTKEVDGKIMTVMLLHVGVGSLAHGQG